MPPFALFVECETTRRCGSFYKCRNFRGDRYFVAVFARRMFDFEQSEVSIYRHVSAQYVNPYLRARKVRSSLCSIKYVARSETIGTVSQRRYGIGIEAPNGWSRNFRIKRSDDQERRLSRNTACSPNIFQNHHGAFSRSGVPHALSATAFSILAFTLLQRLRKSLIVQ